MKLSKRMKEIHEKVNLHEEYSLSDAIKALKEVSSVKFTESLDCAMRLGVDPRHADQMVRGTVSLPHGTGKKVKVLEMPPKYILEMFCDWRGEGVLSSC